MKDRRWLTVTLATLTLLAFALSMPRTWLDYLERGQLYLFSSAFWEDLPKRLTGPGRLRFLIQPITAFSIGMSVGKVRGVERGHFDLRPVLNLILLGILIDAIAQRLILGVVHPAAALLVGPVLIVLPFSIGRVVGDRVASRARANQKG
jgi:hypothetical protein